MLRMIIHYSKLLIPRMILENNSMRVLNRFNRFATLKYENYFPLIEIGKNFQRVSLSMQYPRNELLLRK